jgi:hypothetical protein
LGRRSFRPHCCRPSQTLRSLVFFTPQGGVIRKANSWNPVASPNNFEMFGPCTLYRNSSEFWLLYLAPYAFCLVLVSPAYCRLAISLPPDCRVTRLPQQGSEWRTG